MRIYNVQAPDGNTYRVQAPEGEKDEDIFRFVEEQLRTQNQAAGKTPQEAVSTTEYGYGDENFYESENPSALRDVADVGVSVASGLSKAFGATVGLGSYVKGLNVIADPIAAKLQDFGAFIDESLLSDRQKEINKELATRLAEVAPTLPENATFDDYMEALKAGGGEAWEYIKDHPTQVFNLIAASAPYIVGGGVIAKGLKGGAELAGLEKVSKVLSKPAVAGAAGEGSIVGGQVVTDMIAATDSVGEYSAERLKALGSIPVTTAFSLLGARATRLMKGGIDIDSAVAGKIVEGKNLLGDFSGSGVGNTVYKTGVGMIVEGAEETAQGAAEKYFENYAVNEGYDMLQPKLLEGVGSEGVLSGITGSAQSGGINLTAGLIGNQNAGNSESDLDSTPDIQEVENYVNEVEAEKEAGAEQTAEAQIEEQRKSELRELHLATFPNEKEWNKLNKEDEFEAKRLEIQDPNSELGQDFRAWQAVEGDGIVGKYDTEPGTNIPLAATVRAYLGKESTTSDPVLYKQALDEHAALQEVKATESAPRQKRIEKMMQKLLDSRNAALANNDLEQLAMIEAAIAKHTETNPSFPARFREFVRNSKTKKPATKKKDTKKEATPISQLSGEELQEMIDNAVVMDMDDIDTSSVEDLGSNETLDTKEDEKTAGDKEGQEFFGYIKEIALKDRADTGYLGIDDSPETQELNEEIVGLLDDHNVSLEEGDTEMVDAIEEEVLELVKQAPVLEETFREAAIRKNATKKPEELAELADAIDVLKDKSEEVKDFWSEKVNKGDTDTDAFYNENVIPAKIAVLQAEIAHSEALNKNKPNKNIDKTIAEAKEKIEALKKEASTEEVAEDKSNEEMVVVLNRDNSNLSKEEFEKKHPGFKDLWNFPDITQEDVDVRGEPAQVTGDFAMDKDQWQFKLVTFLQDASRRGVLSDYVSFKSSMSYTVKKNEDGSAETQEQIAKKFNASVEEIFPKPEKVKKKVKVNDKRLKNPTYRVEYSDAEVAPLKVNSKIQIPLTKKIFDSLPIEEKYRAAKWEMSKLSDELGIIDESTGEPYLSEKGKDNVKDALISYRKKHLQAGKDKTSARELINLTMERTAFAEAFSGEETSADIEFEETATATRESQSDIDEETASMERGGRPTRETTPKTDLYAKEEGEVTLEQVSQGDKAETGTQILKGSPENYKVGNVPDAKAKKQIDASFQKLKREATNLQSAATKAKTKLEKEQIKLKKARGKTRIAALTAEVKKLKSDATKKRNQADKAVKARDKFQSVRIATDDQKVAKQRAFNERDTELPGTAKLETLEQQEKEKKKRIARAETILEGVDDVSIGQAAALESAWNDNKKDETPPFSKLTIPQRLEWADRVLLAVHDKAPKDIKNQQKQMEETLNEYIGKPTTQSKEVAARRKQKNREAKSRNQKLSRKGDTKKILSKTAAEAYGKAKLEPIKIYGTKWRSHPDNAILKTHLKNKDFGAYQRIVDKRAADAKGKKSKGFTNMLESPPENYEILFGDNPEKKQNLENMFRRLLGDKGYKRIRNRVYYFKTPQEADRVMKEEFGADQETIGSESAFVQKWNIAGQPDIIVFILGRMPLGSEASTFVHEVAGHIGLESVLTKQELRVLQQQIEAWHKEDKDTHGNEPYYNLEIEELMQLVEDGTVTIESVAQSKEHLMARYAVRKARGKGYINKKTGTVPSATVTAETLAYFLQTGIQIGIEPSLADDTGKILYKMKQAMLKFLGFFNIIPFGKFNMTGQDLIDMALGMAKVELESGFRIGKKPQSQKVLKAIRIATAGDRANFKERLEVALNGTEADTAEFIESLETEATQRFAQEPSDPMNIKNWDAEIDAAARRKFPKDKGKYVPNDGSRVPLSEWGNFQKAKYREEKAFRAGAKAHIEQMIKDAAENEANMSDPEGRQYTRSFTREEKKQSKEEAKKDRQKLIEKSPSLLSMYDSLTDGIQAAQKSMRFKGDFINKYKDKLPGLKEAANVMLASSKVARNIKKKVDNIAVLERVLKPGRRKIVNKIIEVATSTQVWPSQMRPTKDKDGNDVPRRKITVDAKFKKLFESVLSPSEQDIVMQVFEHGEDMIQMYREIAKELGLENDFFSITQLEGPYAPLRRFGKHTVTLRSQKMIDLEERLEKEDLAPFEKRRVTARIKELRSNEKHFWYQHFPNKGTAQRFKREQEKTGNWGENGAQYSPKAVALGDRGTADQKVLEQINSALELTEMDSIAKAQFQRIINDIYTASISESNARQGQQLRQNIAGAEQNMLRSFVVNASSEANLVANLKFGRAVNLAIATVRTNATEIDRTKGNPDGAMMNVYNMLANHYNIRLRKKNHPIVDSVASFITAWLLTTSLSYHLQNGSQTVAVAVPVIAADFKSYNQVMRQLPKSYRIAHNVISYDKKIPLVGKKKATWTLNVNLEDLKKEDEWALPILALLDEMELLDLGIEQDLNDTNTQDTGFAAADKGIRVAGTISHRLYQVPRGVEAYNRIATALTAYKLGLENPKVMRILKTNPLDYAIKKTQDTQGDFTADGAPYALKWVMERWGGVGKLALQYKKFPLLMAWNYSRSVNMMWSGESAEQKAIGRRATRNLLAHTFMLSGLRGLPAIAAIYGMSVFFLSMMGDEDEDDSDSNPLLTDGAFERAIVEAFPDNPKLAEAIYRSPLTALTGVDLSMKLSHDKIFSLLPYTDLEVSEEGFKDIGVGLMGPFGNVAMNVAIANEHFEAGNTYKGIELLMPKGLRDPMEAWRFHTEGYTNRKSRVKAPPTDFKTVDLILKSLGIPSRDIGKLKAKSSEQYQIKKFFKDREIALINQYEKAFKKNDKKVMNKLTQEWYKVQDGKDNIRWFFNNAPSAIPRRDVKSLTDVGLRKFIAEEDIQEEMETGVYKFQEDGDYGAKFAPSN